MLRCECPAWVWCSSREGEGEGEDAFNSGKGVLDLLASFDIVNVDAESRGSVYKRSVGQSVGPALLRSVSNLNTTMRHRGR